VSGSDPPATLDALAPDVCPDMSIDPARVLDPFGRHKGDSCSKQEIATAPLLRIAMPSPATTHGCDLPSLVAQAWMG